MNNIAAWLKSHSPTSKSVATLWLSAVFLYGNNPAFHDYLVGIYSTLPHGLHSFIVGAVVPAAIFWRTTHSTKVTAEIEDDSAGVVKASATATTVAPDVQK